MGYEISAPGPLFAHGRCSPFGSLGSVELPLDPDHVSVCVRSQPAVAVVEKYKVVVPWVSDDHASADRDVERLDDDTAAGGNEAFDGRAHSVDCEVGLGPRALGLNNQFRFRLGQA